MPGERETDRVTRGAGPLTGTGTQASRGGQASPGGQASRDGTATPAGRAPREQMPRVAITRRRVLASVAFVIAIVAFLYLGLPKLVGFGKSFERLENGDARWLIAAAALEICSFTGYVVLMRAVFADQTDRFTWKVSYQVTMAGLAATRLLATAGAGGIALTAWALRRTGMEARAVATRMVALMALLYGVYMGVLVLGGIGLYLGVIPGPGPFAITILPAIFGAVVMLLFTSMALLPRDIERWAAQATGDGFGARMLRRLATVPDSAASGIRTTIALVRGGDPRLLGAPAWWGFDIATLWAAFHAFGYAPEVGVIVMAYFVGWLANTLPLPGGIGGVEGGMIGAFTAFDVSVQAAVVAVLAYRAFSFWLPTLPGAVAYFQLRGTVRRWEDAESANA